MSAYFCEVTMTETPDKTLFVTDAEMIRRLGVPENEAYRIIRELDAKKHATGFPQKVALWGNRRYWPAVEQYFENTYGLKRPKETAEIRAIQRRSA